MRSKAMPSIGLIEDDIQKIIEAVKLKYSEDEASAFKKIDHEGNENLVLMMKDLGTVTMLRDTEGMYRIHKFFDVKDESPLRAELFRLTRDYTDYDKRVKKKYGLK